MTRQERQLVLMLADDVAFLLGAVDPDAISAYNRAQERRENLLRLAERVRHEADQEDRKHRRESRDSGDRTRPQGRR